MKVENMRSLTIKKVILLVLLLILLSVCFVGCGDNTVMDSGKLSVITVNFPAYDFTREICGDNAEVTLLLPLGTDSHSYDPSPKDIIKIAQCDLFIYTGGESDLWLDGILDSLDKPVTILKMMDCVDVLQEEITESMQKDEEKDEEEDEDEIEYDEHVWTSPKNAVKITQAITRLLCEIDIDNSEIYTANSEAYIKQLRELDKKFSDFFDTAGNKSLVFGDRFPFRYFTDAYGLRYDAAFPGCSADNEASLKTITALIEKVKAENLRTVFYIEFSTHSIADSIAEAAGVKTAMLHTCHNITKEELQKGASYISLMERNLEVLKEALG